MRKIVIIGANDFQRPLIQKAKVMGYETHVFAWREGASGAADADKFLPELKKRILRLSACNCPAAPVTRPLLRFTQRNIRL